MQIVTVDTECYKNFFLVMFKNHENGKTFTISALDDVKQLDLVMLRKIMRNRKTIGFNSLNYDLPMISAAMSGYSLKQLKALSDEIVNEGKPSWITYREHGIIDFKFDHIDIKEPSAGVMVSLKLYGARMNMPKLQDLPIEPDATLTREQADEITRYCENDLDTTWELYTTQKSAFELREKMSAEYGVDLMSKSDAQVAEAVFRHELTKQKVRVDKPKLPNNYSFKFKTPPWLTFKSNELNEILNTVKACRFKLSAAGKPVLPKEINKAFEFNGKKYKFGIGGLHSQEKKQVVTCDDGCLFDIDVASYYPFIILGQGLFPKHLTRKFLTVYKSIVDRRIEAKRKVQELEKERSELKRQLAELELKD